MPGPYVHAYAAVLLVVLAAWHAVAGNVSKAVLAGACCVAFGMAAALEAMRRPARRVAVPAGLPWWCYLTTGERVVMATGLIVWAVTWAVVWAAVAS
jgi:hypothetical protein